MKFYRYEIESKVSFLGFTSRISLALREYNLHKETNKGWWIGYGSPSDGSLRSSSWWVSKTAKKRYAYPTKEEAITNLKHRLRWRLKIAQNTIHLCTEGLKLIKDEKAAKCPS